jgi:hypothetical protein
MEAAAANTRLVGAAEYQYQVGMRQHSICLDEKVVLAKGVIATLNQVKFLLGKAMSLNVIEHNFPNYYSCRYCSAVYNSLLLSKSRGLCRREPREIGVQRGKQHVLQLLLAVVKRQVQTVEARVA